MDQLALTKLLNEIELSNEQASANLFQYLYSQLKQMASRQLQHDNSDLQATGLVHEAFLKLFGNEHVSWKNRRHFFGAAAQAMRRILIDMARARATQKRGGDQIRVTFCEAILSQQHAVDFMELLDLDDAIRALEQEDSEMAQIVELRFFAGQSMADIAKILDTSLSSVERKWRVARAFLVSKLQKQMEDT